MCSTRKAAGLPITGSPCNVATIFPSGSGRNRDQELIACERTRGGTHVVERSEGLRYLLAEGVT